MRCDFYLERFHLSRLSGIVVILRQQKNLYSPDFLCFLAFHMTLL